MASQAENQIGPVAVIGAGPAGLYAARYLADHGVEVALLNRDIKPGGLAEYGIYYNKYRMKKGLRKQFRQILEESKIHYFGNVTVGEGTGLSLEDLKKFGFPAILVTVGAQGTKWLGLPGEELDGVYHAKDIVYHYNKLPPYGTQDFLIGKRVALIGVGNVMLDIARWLIRDLKVDEVVALARRGPAEVKFSKKEMESVILNLDMDEFNQEMRRVAPVMEGVGQDVQAAKDFILSALPKADDRVSDTLFRLEFLASPSRMIGDGNRRVKALEVEETTLVPRNGDTKAKGLGEHRQLDIDTVIFCIGDRVDEEFGLPVQWNEFVKHPKPRYPENDLSYEAYNHEAKEAIEGVFVAGWSREASSGLVGVARKDGENGARALLRYLDAKQSRNDPQETLERLNQHLQEMGAIPVRKEHLEKLEAYEETEAQRQGLEDFKLKSNQEMLEVMGLAG